MNPAWPGKRRCPPAEEWHKINTDGSFASSERCGGGGVVMGDHNGAFVAGASHFFCCDLSGGCRRAVELAEDCCRRFGLETDSANVVKKLNEEEKEKSVLGPLIEDLKISFRNFDQVEVESCKTHVKRSSPPKISDFKAAEISCVRLGLVGHRVAFFQCLLLTLLILIKLQPVPLKKSSPLTIDEKEVTTETHKSHI
jgi:ribonuclease HI